MISGKDVVEFLKCVFLSLSSPVKLLPICWTIQMDKYHRREEGAYDLGWTVPITSNEITHQSRKWDTPSKLSFILVFCSSQRPASEQDGRLKQQFDVLAQILLSAVLQRLRWNHQYHFQVPAVIIQPHPAAGVNIFSELAGLFKGTQNSDV